ncbi:HAD family hydrolase [Desulfogranum mediterraneum]|uniref:HAD family hydrolase n=1 Tax=Desulfogranum mediterraneum TaxID=160661 RepID=UPI000403CB0E|nr:HAD family hydrolase [Desulfogranum mediterraneum]
MIPHPPEWQAVFFDFDGVIADSVQVKTRAFAAMFQAHGQNVVDQAIAYHLSHGGMPRQEKLRRLYRELLGLELEPEQLQQLGQEFSARVLDGVVAARFIPGALECLEQLQAAETPAFVVSGTPEEEMRTIVRRKKIAHYFQEVHGAPRAKTEIVSEVLGRCGFAPEQCLFIGDALADYTAAANTGLCFLAITGGRARVSFPPGTPCSPRVRLSLP